MDTALTASEILSRSADLIEPEGAWTRDFLARTAAGNPIGPSTPGAICWCMLGAIDRVLFETGAVGDAASEAYSALEDLLARDSTTGPISTWNDDPNRTQAEVVAALRKASELARLTLGDDGCLRTDVRGE